MSIEPRNTLCKAERLCGLRNINALFAGSQGGFTYPFKWVLLSVPTDAENDADKPIVSVLFSVPKKNIRRANKRNLLKRRMREAYRLNKHSLANLCAKDGKKLSLALIYVAKEPLEYSVIEPVIKKILTAVEGAC